MSLFKTQPPGGLDAEGKKELSPDERQSLQAILIEKENNIRLARGLPFLFGWKWYSWAREFYESRNKVNLLTAANQISKSSTQIRKLLNWSTDQDLWPDLWVQKPTQFWYLYPTQEQVNIEYETKWSQFVPQNGFEKNGKFAFDVEKKHGDVKALHFHSGVHSYFKTYAQSAQALQTGTCDAIFCDEELPVELFDELMLRLSASSGYFNMVFTATMGQDFWRRAMEPAIGEQEVLAEAFKKQVSLYDAMFYDDGTPSHWSAEKIALVRQRCSTEQEVLKRVYGKFILIGGRKYESFDIKRHMKPHHPVPKGWYVYAGVDIGSGGQKKPGKKGGHPSAIVFVAVRPDFRAGRVIKCWRGDGIDTTAGDVVEKFIEMKNDLKERGINLNGQYYDWQNKDFFNIATRMGESFEGAEKGHDIGEDVINTLFKNDMLFIYEDSESAKLGGELSSVSKTTLKRDAMDDLCDGLRYAVTKIPWDWSVITGADSPLAEKPELKMTDIQRQVYERRKAFEDDTKSAEQSLQDEFNELNDAYGNG